MISEDVRKEFEGKRVLVTGGTGLIGRPVVDRLVEYGADVTVVSLDNLSLNDSVSYINADLRYFDVVQSLVNGKDYVFHLAGIKGGIDITKNSPATVFVPYLQFNTNVLEASRISGVKKLVYTSTIGAYQTSEVFVEEDILSGTPMDVYAGWAKRMAELQIRAYKIQYGLKNFVAVRPANVYGEGDNFDPENAMVIPSLMHKIMNRKEGCKLNIWGNGTAIRDFAYSGDVAEGIILALHYMPDVDYLNIGSGVGHTIKEMVETLNQVVPFEYEWDIEKSNGFPKRVMDITKAKELIHFSPDTSLLEGLTKTWNWFKQNQFEFQLRKNYFTKS